MKARRNRPAGIAREPVTLAILAAIVVTGVLAFAVFAIWSSGSGPSSPQLVAPAPRGDMTPTPRTVHWPRPTAAAVAGSGSPAAGTPSSSGGAAITPNVSNVPDINAVPSPSPAPSPTEAPSPTTTPDPTAESTSTPPPPPTAPPTPSATPTPEPAFAADDAASFNLLMSGSWAVSGDEFVYDSPQAQAEPLLLVPYQTRSGDFAIEAEIKVNGLAEGVCNQSFGVVAGSPVTGLYWGGGVIYTCGSSTPAARITDVSNWTNGYDQDRQLARANFDPNEEWHRYRLEIRGDELRLLIDGEEALTATDPALQGGRTTGQTGLWTQGTHLSVRSLAIHEL